MMVIAESLDLWLFAAAILFLMSGYPVAMVLGGTGLLFAGIGYAFGVFEPAFLAAIPSRLFGIMTSQVLIAVPMFVFMGAVLQRSHVAEELLETFAVVFRRFPGGLGLSVMFVGMLLAASTGIVGATVVTMGMLSLPAMLKQGYSPKLASGMIAASGTLGQIIPPSIVLVILADQISNAWQKAQLDSGNFSPETVTVGDLFAGALLPGLMLVTLYMVYLVAVSIIYPPKPAEQSFEPQAITAGKILRVMVSPLVLIVLVLGSILTGIATPTEAASVGAVGAVLLATARIDGRKTGYVGGASLIALLLIANIMDLRVARNEIPLQDMIAIAIAGLVALVALADIGVSLLVLHRAGILREVVRSTTRVTTMIFAILIGASIFSLVFRGLGGDETIKNALQNLPGGTFGALFMVMALMFLLGFFLDFLEISFVVVPLVAPVLLQLPMADGNAMSPVWLGILIAVNLQTSFLTPPFGVALFYLRGVAPPSVRSSDIYRGIVPFVAIQLLALVILWNFPILATGLPIWIYQ